MGRIGQRIVTGVLGMLAGGSTRAPLAVSANNVERNRSGIGVEGEITTTQSPNVTAKGGTGSYSYLWTQVSGDTVTISSDTAQNPAWTATVAEFDPNESTWRVTVTDGASDTASFDITVTMTWISF